MSATSSERDDEINLGALFGVLWRGKLWIALGAFLGVAAGAFNVANTDPTFRADALLQLEEGRASMALPSSLAAITEEDPRSVTEIEILRSRMVLAQAVASENLDWRIDGERAPIIGTMVARYWLPLLHSLVSERYARPGDVLMLDSLTVPPAWLNQSMQVVAGEEGRFVVTTPDGEELSGEVRVPLSAPDNGFSMIIGTLEAASGRVFAITQIDERRAMDDLRARLSVSERGRGSGILEVGLTGGDRSNTARALNAILQAYLRQNISRSAAEAESSLAFIREQLPSAERSLREAEAALNAFRQQQVTIDLTLETQTVLGQITRLENDLAALLRQEDEIAQRYTPSHPTYRQLLDERARLETRLAELRVQVGAMPETQRQVLNMARNVELAQGIYTELLTRAQEVEVVRASTIGNVRIVDGADPARQPIAPRKSMVLALSLLLGALAGLVAVMLRSWLRKGVPDTATLERLGLPVFATINYSKGADTQGQRKGQMSLLALTSTADLTIEAMRSLRTSLHFGMLDAQTPTLTITSSHPGAGKSFLAANLAAVTAEAGQRVLLIDADLRRGQLRRYFDVGRNTGGLAEVLAGDMQPEKAVLQGPLPNLFLLMTGRYPPNPSELLMRPELGDLISWCSDNFDLVIFDAPPILAVTDPVILSRRTGATIFVARHDLTAVAEVEASIKAMASAGLRFSGAVLNGFDPRKAKGGYGYGYGYRYEYKQRKE